MTGGAAIGYAQIDLAAIGRNFEAIRRRAGPNRRIIAVLKADSYGHGAVAIARSLADRSVDYLAIGSILAGGTLGILIPPSAMLIVYGMVDNSSIGQLYAGAFLPGFLLAALYLAYVAIRCTLNPTMGPPFPPEERLPISRSTGEEAFAPHPHATQPP